MIAMLLLVACKEPDGDPSPARLFSDDITRVVVEVDYVPGAEPYTGDQGGGQVWELFATNAEALLGSEKDIVSPSGLSDMDAIADPGVESFDRDAILALAEANRDDFSEGETAAFYALWLDGHYESSEGVQEGVIGVSLTGTSVVAMFAPVVQQLGLTDFGRGFGEQATFTHEFGHAIGLVNNGIPVTSDHHDEENGAHCTEDSCVMYWAYEGSSELQAFIAQYVATSNTILFGDECMDDVEAMRE